MHNYEIKKNSASMKMERVFLSCCFTIIVAGIAIDVLGWFIFEIDQERLNEICSTIVGIQATVFSIVFSLLSLFSGFQDKEKYGIPIVRYLMKYRRRFLSQFNILLLELCLLVFSTVFLFFGYTNTLFCCFLVSLGLILFLASEAFMLYRPEDINEEMFNFLKDNSHNTQLKLFDEYIAAEEKRIAQNERPCESRTWELWLYEVEEYSDNLGNEEYGKIHDAFVSLVLKYLEDSNNSTQQYGIDCALKVLEAYYSHRNPEPQKDKWGITKNDISTILANDAFLEWMNVLVDIAYTEQTTRCRVSDIISCVHKFEKHYSIYSKQTSVNNFFDVLVLKVGEHNSDVFSLKSFLHYVLLRIMTEKDNSLKKQNLSYAIHLSLLIIERGYPQLVEEELFEKYLKRFKEPEYEFYFVVIVCFLYYIVFAASDEEIEYFSLNKLDRERIRNIFKSHKKAIINRFRQCAVSVEYCNEIKQYLRQYEFLIPNKGSKVMIMDSVIDRCLIFFMMMSTPWNIGACLRELVDNDWYRIYMTVVNNDFSKEQFNEISALMSSFADYEKLENAVEDISRSMVIDGKESVTEEEEAEFRDRISGVLREFTKRISIGEMQEGEAIKFTIYFDVRHLALTDSIYAEEYGNDIRQYIIFQLGEILIQKLNCKEVYDHRSAKAYLEQSKTYDFRFGNKEIPLYDNDRELRKCIQDSIPDKYNTSLIHNGFPVIIDVQSERVGINVDAEVIVRKLTDEEKLERYNCTGDKYRQQIVNDIYFEFGKEEFFRYADNEYRMLEIKCSMEVSAEPDSGTYTLLK